MDFEEVNQVIRGMESTLQPADKFFWIIPGTASALFWDGKELLFFRNGETNCGKALSRQKWGIRKEVLENHLTQFYDEVTSIYPERFEKAMEGQV